MRVLTYTNPRELPAHPDWPTLSSTIHLCATNTLAKGLTDAYPDVAAVSVSLLLSGLLAGWVAPTNQLQQYVALTGVIDDLASERLDWRQRLRAFRRNQADVLKGIRTLAEGGVQPDHLTCRTEDEAIYREVWSRLAARDRHLQDLRDELYGRLAQRAHFRQRFARALHRALAKAKNPGTSPGQMPDRLILHGFYFITPLQMRLIRLLEAAGTELVFANCWDERYPYVFRCWDRFFPDRTAWSVHAGPPPTAAGALLGEVCEGVPLSVDPKHTGLRLLRYPDLSAFLNGVVANQARAEAERAVLCSPAADELNDLLRLYYPEAYPSGHFLSYPVGQFLYHLHAMWDEQENDMVLSAEALLACFGSGLLRVQSGAEWLEGRDLIPALLDAMPYFSGCRKADEWLQRAEQLTELLRSRVPQWDPVPVQGPAAPFQVTLGNPARLLSHLQLSAETADRLHLLLAHLCRTAAAIFRGQTTVSLAEHMRRLRRLLVANGSDQRLLPQERTLLEGMLHTLESVEGEALDLPVKDLSEAVALYLSTVGKGDADPFSLPGAEQEALVQPLAALDGLPLTQRTIHVCLLNDPWLPDRRRTIPWPLRVESFGASAPAETVQLLADREESAPAASLYLLYAALAFSRDVVISWVGEWEQQKQQESVYLLMLKSVGLPEEPALGASWNPTALVSIDRLEPKVKRAWQKDHLPPYAVAEYAVCPRRFYYSYIAAERPAFRSEFLAEFIYGRLLAWHQERFRSGIEQARREIDPLFPAWSDVRRRDLTERWAQPLAGGNRYLGQEYSALHRWLLVPAYTQMTAARRVLEEPERLAKVVETMGQGQELHWQMEAEPSDGCRYCPHIARCAVPQFPVDDR